MDEYTQKHAYKYVYLYTYLCVCVYMHWGITKFIERNHSLTPGHNTTHSAGPVVL